MPSLLDTIKQNSQPQQAGMEDNTSLAATLQRAKSGKQVSGSAPVSNIGEQVANQDTNAQLQQVGQQAQVQNLAAGQQQQQVAQQGQQQATEIQQGRNANQMQARLKTNELLQGLEQAGQTLDQDKKNAQMEQLGFNLAMQDKTYTDQLQREGAKQRLNDRTSFADAAARQSLGDGLDIFQQQLGGKNLIAANDREFTRALAQMDMDSAMQMANNAAKAAQIQGTASAVGGIADAGIKGWSDYNKQQSTARLATTAPATQPSAGAGNPRVQNVLKEQD